MIKNNMSRRNMGMKPCKYIVFATKHNVKTNMRYDDRDALCHP
jgi:hypothetical protein